MYTQISNANIVLRDTIVRNGICRFRDGTIDYIGTREQTADKYIDAGGSYVMPGFIDLHCHGGNGFDFMDASPEEMADISEFHLRHGTTAMLATTMTDTAAATERVLKNFKELVSSGNQGTLHGVHLEGPWLNPAQCGAQDLSKMSLPSAGEVNRLKDAYPFIERISVAPELQNGMEAGRAGKARGVVMSVAHTDADFDTAISAADNGYVLMTHLYSGMKGVERKNAYRVAGAVEAGLYDDRFFVEIIADGKHLPGSLLKFIVKVKGCDKICLITDATRASGLKDRSESILGRRDSGVPIIVEDGVAKTPDRKSFAGSVATMDRLVKVMYFEAGCSLVDIGRMASAVPARIMGYTDRGELSKGKRADLVFLDRSLNVEKVILKGEEIE